jgi:hypothetical protein
VSLLDHIERSRERIRRADFPNEAAISQSIVLPTLLALGWDTTDPQIVYPEYAMERKRVDYALFNNARQVTYLIEVKALGNAAGGDRQLFEYAFHSGVPLILLTDGREWHFYLPGETGNYEERRVYKLDLLEWESDEAAERLERYLDCSRVWAGSALQDARRDYEQVARGRVVAATLPRAWRRLVDEQDELVDLLSRKVEDLCGFRAEIDPVVEFLSDAVGRLPTEPSPAAQSAQPQLPITNLGHRPAEDGDRASAPHERHAGGNEVYSLPALVGRDMTHTKPSYFDLDGDRVSVVDWADLSVQLVAWLFRQGKLSLNDLPILNASGRDKYLINKRPEHADPRRNGSWRSLEDCHVDIKYSAEAHVRNAQSLLDRVGISSSNMKIGFRPGRE